MFGANLIALNNITTANRNYLTLQQLKVLKNYSYIPQTKKHWTYKFLLPYFKNIKYYTPFTLNVWQYL